MKSRAAVAWEAAKPLVVETVDIEGPKRGEVLLQVKATGVCHTDAYTLSGKDPEGIFPCIMGHEGGAVVAEGTACRNGSALRSQSGRGCREHRVARRADGRGGERL